jgi:putative acetyltransferase
MDRTMRGADVVIAEALKENDLREARRLLEEYFASLAGYLASLELDLTAARQREVASLPGEYAPPGGRLLLAREGGAVAGCVALRRLGPSVCELRRLYVRPLFRGAGLGRHLTVAAIAAARAMAYERVRLNSLPTMERARALYAELGFREIPNYREVVVPGVTFLELQLSNSEPPAAAPGT